MLLDRKISWAVPDRTWRHHSFVGAGLKEREPPEEAMLAKG
jgi:hypothetical protein